MVPGPLLKEAEQHLSGSKLTTALHPCVRTEGGGLSAGVGFAVRSHTGLGNWEIEGMHIPKSVAGRFILKHWEAMCRGGTGLGTV